MFTITKDWINKNKTPAGAWNAKQLLVLNVKWPPRKGWQSRSAGKEITLLEKSNFESLRISRKKSKSNSKLSTALNKSIELCKEKEETLRCVKYLESKGYTVLFNTDKDLEESQQDYERSLIGHNHF